MGNLFKCTGGSCSDAIESKYIYTPHEDSFIEGKTILEIMGMNYEEYKGGYAFSSLEEFITKYEPYAKRGVNPIGKYTTKVIESIKNNNGKKVCVNVEGAVTVLGVLINPVILFKAARKNKEELLKALSFIEDFLKLYIIEIKNADASIISFADPSGNYDIVGPKFFNEIIYPISFSLINFINKELNLSIHLCGRLSTALEKEGHINVKKVMFKEEMEYAKGLSILVDEAPIIVGHACTKTFNLKRKLIWVVLA